MTLLTCSKCHKQFTAEYLRDFCDDCSSIKSPKRPTSANDDRVFSDHELIGVSAIAQKFVTFSYRSDMSIEGGVKHDLASHYIIPLLNTVRRLKAEVSKRDEVTVKALSDVREKIDGMVVGGITMNDHLDAFNKTHAECLRIVDAKIREFEG